MPFSDRNEVSSRLGLVRKPTVGPYGVTGPYSLGDLGAFAPRDGQVPGTAQVPVGFRGLGGLTEIFSTDWGKLLLLAGAAAALFFGERAGWFSQEG
jgi:hypothetical protein